jgi:WD40 repeat protein
MSTRWTCPNGHLLPAPTKQPPGDAWVPLVCPVCGVDAVPTAAWAAGAPAAGSAVGLFSGSPPAPGVDAAATATLPPLAAFTNALPATLPTDAWATAMGVAGSPDGYEILAELGRGGMGVVYQARQTALQRTVALKMILGGGHASGADLKRFRTEAESIARLQHPHIVQIYEVGEHNGLPYFSLEFCAGGSLEKKLGGTPLPPRQAAALVEKLAHAMQAAHDKGVIHRDLKPANVLLAEDGTPKITDFGLAKKLDDAAKTQTGAIMGTPSYMSPEQAQGKSSELGPPCDIYSLGAILYECLTGRPPFRAATPLDTVLQVVSAEPVPPTELNALVPRDLETICLKCLHKETAKRYATARDLAEDLRRYQADEAILARRASALERAVKWARRRPAVAALLAAVALSLLAGAAVSTCFAIDAHNQAEASAANARKAEDSAALAGEKERQTQAERDRVRKVNLQLQDSQEELGRTLYAARMNLVQAAWDGDNISVVRDLLEQLRPKPGEIDIRGFEWHYWNRLSHAELLTVALGPGVFGCHSTALSSDGARFAAVVVSNRPDKQGSFATALRMWDTGTGKQLHSIQPPAGEDSWDSSSVVLSPDGTRFVRASGTAPRDIAVWDAVTGKKLFAIPSPGNFTVRFSPDGKRLQGVVKTRKKSIDTIEVKVWDASTGQEIATHPLSNATGALATFTIVGMVSVSPDGKRVAAPALSLALDMKTFTHGVWVWDTASGKSLFTLAGHSTEVNINDPASMNKIEPFGIFDVTFSPDGSRLAAVHMLTGIVKIWDAATGKEIKVFSAAWERGPAASASTGQGGGLSFPSMSNVSLVYSPDGKLLAGIGLDRTVRIWDADKGHLRLSLMGHTRTVTAVIFSPDNKSIYTASQDGTMKVWDSAARAGSSVVLNVLPLFPMGSVPALSADGNRLALVSLSPGKTVSAEVKVMEVATGRELATLAPVPGPADSDCAYPLAISADGQRLAAVTVPGVKAKAGAESAVRIWDTTTGKELVTFTVPFRAIVNLTFSPDAQRLAAVVSSQDGEKRREEIKVWDAVTGKEILAIAEGSFLQWEAWPGLAGPGMAFSPDGKRLATIVMLSENDKQSAGVRVWDAMTGKVLLTIPGGPYTFRSPVFSPDGKHLAVAASTGSILGSGDTVFASSGEVKVYDSVTGRQHLALKGHHSGSVHCVTFNPKGTRIATTGGYVFGTGQVQDEVKLWDAVTGQQLMTSKEVAPQVTSMAFSADGNRLVLVGSIPLGPPIVQVWDGTPLPEKLEGNGGPR